MNNADKKIHNNENIKTDNFNITKQTRRSQFNVALFVCVCYIYMCDGVSYLRIWVCMYLRVGTKIK